MALSFRAISLYPYPPPSSSSSSTTTSSSSSSSHAPFLVHQKALLFKPSCAAFSRSAQSEPTEGELKEDDPPAAVSDLDIYSAEASSSSARAQLDLLEQLTSTTQLKNGYQSAGVSSRRLKIRDQLAQLVGDMEGEFSIPLGKDLKKVSEKFLTISQKRNIRRQAYLDQVSQRNDSVFFATVGAFVILPPVIILGIAIFTGSVQLFP